jgi:hypothetical protein
LEFAGGGLPPRWRRSLELRPRSTAFVALASPWRCAERFPRAGLHETEETANRDLEEEDAAIRFVHGALSGVGPPGPVLGDFPLAWGLPPLQGVKGGSGDGAPPTATAGRRRGQLAEGLCCIFAFVGDLSVMFPN